jgi:hypothetical protein
MYGLAAAFDRVRRRIHFEIEDAKNRRLDVMPSANQRP